MPRSILASDWARLTDEERQQAIEMARREGRCAASWDLDGPAEQRPVGKARQTDRGRRPGTRYPHLRNSRWAREEAGTAELDDDTFFLYASMRTLPCEDDYITCVVEACCPGRADGWWQTPPEDRRRDPRVCAFCDGYERERCRIFGMPAPPTRVTELQSHLHQAREQERERGRDWLRHTEELDLSQPERARRFVARWEYQRCTFATDLAQMLLDGAVRGEV